MRCLFPWLMIQQRLLRFIVAVLHIFLLLAQRRPPSVLCMNSHCHVQGRVQPAQGQLIAFMIMISRQIYCAARGTSSGLTVVALRTDTDFTAAAVLFKRGDTFGLIKS